MPRYFFKRNFKQTKTASQGQAPEGHVDLITGEVIQYVYIRCFDTPEPFPVSLSLLEKAFPYFAMLKDNNVKVTSVYSINIYKNRFMDVLHGYLEQDKYFNFLNPHCENYMDLPCFSLFELKIKFIEWINPSGVQISIEDKNTLLCNLEKILSAYLTTDSHRLYTCGGEAWKTFFLNREIDQVRLTNKFMVFFDLLGLIEKYNLEKIIVKKIVTGRVPTENLVLKSLPEFMITYLDDYYNKLHDALNRKIDVIHSSLGHLKTVYCNNIAKTVYVLELDEQNMSNWFSCIFSEYQFELIDNKIQLVTGRLE